MSYRLEAAPTAPAVVTGPRAAGADRLRDRQWVGVASALLAVYLIWGSTYLGIRVALATSYAYVNPVVAVLLGVALAGEHVHTADLIAMPVILSGVVLVMLGRERH